MKCRPKKLRSALIPFVRAWQRPANIAASSARPWKRRRTSIVRAGTQAARAKRLSWKGVAPLAEWMGVGDLH
jgi:hypothetical protein